MRQAGIGTHPSLSRSPYEALPSDTVEIRWKKNIQRRLLNREYFWPPQWAKKRITALIQNSNRGMARQNTVALGSDVTVQVGGGDDSVKVGDSVMDFLDGYEYIEETMFELNFPTHEIYSRRKWVKWLFWTLPSLSDKGKMHCAEQFLLRYHAHQDWPAAAEKESIIWMEGISLSSKSSVGKAGNGTQASSSSPSRKRKRGERSKAQGDKKDSKSSSESKRDPPKGRVSGTCDSRVVKTISCRSERDGGDGSKCRFSHVCPRCPGENHPASACGKM